MYRAVTIGKQGEDSMDSRIERFIEVAKARLTDNGDFIGSVWQKLYRDLKHALPEEEGNELERQWGEMQRQIRLAQWDENFLKAIEDEESAYKDMVGSAKTQGMYDSEVYTHAGTTLSVANVQGFLK